MPTQELLRQYDAFVPTVRDALTPQRFAHVLRVVETAELIALGNSFSDHERAQLRLASLLHDLAREFSDEELLAHIPARNDVEAGHPMALHGPVGAVLAQQLGVTDETVLRAIELHAFGAPLDDRVSIALYVADKSEPGRGILNDERGLAVTGKLAEAFRGAIHNAVAYLEEKGKQVHPTTYEAFTNVQ